MSAYVAYSPFYFYDLFICFIFCLFVDLNLSSAIKVRSTIEFHVFFYF